MQLALGTVQFGLKYGIAGRGSVVPQVEVKAILKRAADYGICVLDTASAYGDIESNLTSLGDMSQFEIVSKIGRKPSGLKGAALCAWVTREVLQSCDSLGTTLRGLMFHHADDLLDDDGDLLWATCADLSASRKLKLGVSCYDIGVLQKVQLRFPVAIAQIPGNAFDQRFALAVQQASLSPEIYVRSAFLQGLLLMPESRAVARVPAAGAALRNWWEWCESRKMMPSTAALGIVKGFAGASYCVVGVDNLIQFEQLAQAWVDAPAIIAPGLAVDEPAVIDPRRWPAGGA